MIEVHLQGIARTYPGGVVGLHPIDLHLPAGKILVLFGPSGSGKTTLLRLIAGLDRADRGSISFDGQPIDHLPPHRRGIGWVPQRPVLFPHLDVRGNLEFGQRKGWRKRQPNLDRRVEEVADLLGVKELLGRRPAQLSGGQQQRVALGRALIAQCRLLLLDEPMSSLDAPLRWELLQQLHLLHHHFPATMIIVTHDLNEALGLADCLAILHNNRLVQVGSARAVYDRPASLSVAQLLSQPTINLLPGRLQWQDPLLLLQGQDNQLTLPADWADLAGRDVILAIRPEAVRLGATDPPFPNEVLLELPFPTVESGQLPDRVGLTPLGQGAWRLIGQRVGPWPRAALDTQRMLLYAADNGELLRPNEPAAD